MIANAEPNAGSRAARSPTVETGQPALHARALPGVRSISRDVWSSLFPGDAEGWDYYVACETSPPPAFSFAAIAVTSGDRILAAAPTFRVTYRLDTSIQGAWRPLGEWMQRHVPRLVNLPLVGLGSPLADRCHVGFAPDLSAAGRREAMRALLDGLDAYAASDNVSILAIKDLTQETLAYAEAALKAGRFTCVSSLPVAILDLAFESEEAYLASLSAATRKDIRRKLKGAKEVRVERRSTIAGIEQEIVALYDETRHQSEFDYGDFEKLSPDYFRDVLANLGDRSIVMLYWLGERLIGFNLLLIGADRVIDKFIGMRYPLAREHNLYVLSWMTNVRFCLERGITKLQTGQTAYAAKLRFGSRLEKSWMCFKHRGRVINSIFRTFGPLLAFDRMDPDLVALAKK
jgi:Acetyltransferase (GNAT) domain